jgi:hypothetical protein
MSTRFLESCESRKQDTLVDGQGYRLVVGSIKAKHSFGLNTPITRIIKDFREILNNT